MHDLLHPLLNPQSVAVIGASDHIHKIGGRPIHYMRQHGYRGRLYPVNPARAQIQGLAAHAGLGDLPEVPELALIAVGGEQAMAAVQRCAALGVKAAVVIASGFGEAGEAGLALQRQMAHTAAAAGMRLVGPNTQGLANFGTGVVAGFSTMFLEVPPADGPVAVVSQSGGMSAMVYGLLRGQGLGVRHVHATGNEADVCVADLAYALAHDPATRLLLLYLEHIAKPALLAEAAAVARERGLPVLAIRAGRTAAGQRAATSHTGSLANEDRVVDAFFRQHGIWRVRDAHEQVRLAQACLKGWRPAGQRVVIISNSGASCVMGADAAEDAGLALAALAAGTQQALAEKLPGFATTSNPVDITAALLGDSGLFGQVLPEVAKDPAADLFFIHIPVAGAGYDVAAFARDTAEFEARTGKPVAVAAWQEPVAQAFRSQGVLTFANEAQALATLAAMAGHAALVRQPRTRWDALPAPALPPGSGLLNEAQSLAVLQEHGIATVPMHLCRSADDVAGAWRTLSTPGMPAVLKACSREVPHKSEHALVALDVHTPAAARDCFGRLTHQLRQMGAACDGVIVAARYKALRECMVGARWDPVFGPVVVVGDGGKYVEALADCAVLLPPFGEADVLQALGTLRMAPLLTGLRGEPAPDLRALAAIAVACGRLITGAGGRIVAMDLNPVMVAAAGQGATVVDALVELALAPA